MLALVMQKSGRDLASALRARNQRLVLAESCTAGRIAAVLGEIAGISEYFCGSAVAYRNETKAHWLDVPRGLLADPGPVSETVARHMVTGVLARTPEADWAGAITGHLGPDAPQEMDGLVFIAAGAAGAATDEVMVQSLTLKAETRVDRQLEAGARLLEWVHEVVKADR
jgi:PncC family amidohydrolase